MRPTDNGRSPSGPGSSPTGEASKLSSAEPSIPNAWHELHHLVRQAAQAQEAFDQWDFGWTIDPLGRRRSASLEQVERELGTAAAILVAHVIANADALT